MKLTPEEENVVLREKLARRSGRCLVDRCDREGPLTRGRCKYHYDQWNETDDFTPVQDLPNPMVCVCNVPDPCPIGFGDCHSCHRPIVALMSPRVAEIVEERRRARELEGVASS